MSILCANCKAAVPQESRVCLSCQTDAGFPNVRRAEKADEVAALARRVREADDSAAALGALPILNDFTDAVSECNAVMNRRIDDLHSWSTSESQFFASFHPQVREGMIAARDNGWDEQRKSAENAVNPIYFEKLQFAALCLDDEGMDYYGPYCLKLREKLISNRTSVFEENPFNFCEKYKVFAGSAPPVGYRATWAERARLARAKLGSKILTTTKKEEFANILMSSDRDSDRCDFIEVHIYEKVGRDAIETISGPVPVDEDDKLLWKQIKRRLEPLGVRILER